MSSMSLLKITWGIAMMAMPYVFTKSGLILGAFLFLLFTYLSKYTSMVMIRIRNAHVKYTYPHT